MKEEFRSFWNPLPVLMVFGAAFLVAHLVPRAIQGMATKRYRYE